MKLLQFFNQPGIWIILYLLPDYSIPKQSLSFFIIYWGFIHFSPLLTSQLLGIFQNLKGNELNSATSECEPTIVTSTNLTLLWYHGVNMTPRLFDRLNIPNDKIVSITLPFYFFHRSC